MSSADLNENMSSSVTMFGTLLKSLFPHFSRQITRNLEANSVELKTRQAELFLTRIKTGSTDGLICSNSDRMSSLLTCRGSCLTTTRLPELPLNRT